VAAAIHVIELSGGQVVGVGLVIDLPDLGGRKRIEALGHELVAICAFEGE
jgi:adenine phosphoribosyltransferase